MNTRTYISILAVAAVSCFLTSCNTPKAGGETPVAASPQRGAVESVPYVVARNYFINNTVAKVPEVITTQQQFDKCFGMASYMGHDGKPTAIDFNKEFVIAASVGSTDIDTQLTPLSLTHEGDTLCFTCRITRGEKRSFTTNPFAMIVVDKSHYSPVAIELAE